MALAALMGELKHRLPQKIILAHFVHGLRSSHESEQDKKVIVQLAQRYQLPLIFGHPSPPLIATANIEQVARTARRRFLTNLCTNTDDRIMLAHHWDDNIETIYMRLLQHSPVAGLQGIAPQQGLFVRPLLTFYKSELTQFLMAHKVAWHEDSTNESALYLRNRTRRVLTQLTEIEPALPQALWHLARHIAESEQSHETLLASLYPLESFDEETHSLTFPYDTFCTLPPYLRHKLIYRWFNRLMQGIAPPDFRLPSRFVSSITLGKQGPVLLRGHGVIIRRKKNMMVIEREGG